MFIFDQSADKTRQKEEDLVQEVRNRILMPEKYHDFTGLAKYTQMKALGIGDGNPSAIQTKVEEQIEDDPGASVNVGMRRYTPLDGNAIEIEDYTTPRIPSKVQVEYRMQQEQQQKEMKSFVQKAIDEKQEHDDKLLQQEREVPPDSVLCFGELAGEYLECRMQGTSEMVDDNQWFRKPYGKIPGRECFNGGVYWPASCVTVDNRHMMVTGGQEFRGEARNNSYICLNIFTYKIEDSEDHEPFAFERTVNMVYPRYGHALIPVHRFVFAIGGFNNSQNKQEKPRSQATVEQFQVETGEWTEVTSMTTPRAFFGATNVRDQFIYVFGGFHDSKIVDSIERYDQILDAWQPLKLTLPHGLAKLGVTPLPAFANNSNCVIIMGGITSKLTR